MVRWMCNVKVSNGTNCLNLFHPNGILSSTAASASPSTLSMSPKVAELSIWMTVGKPSVKRGVVRVTWQILVLGAHPFFGTGATCFKFDTRLRKASSSLSVTNEAQSETAFYFYKW